MSMPLFVLLTTAGSLIWNTRFVVAGSYLGESWSLVEPWSAAFQFHRSPRGRGRGLAVRRAARHPEP